MIININKHESLLIFPNKIIIFKKNWQNMSPLKTMWPWSMLTRSPWVWVEILFTHIQEGWGTELHNIDQRKTAQADRKSESGNSHGGAGGRWLVMGKPQAVTGSVPDIARRQICCRCFGLILDLLTTRCVWGQWVLHQPCHCHITSSNGKKENTTRLCDFAWSCREPILI